jgi:hypothetical protein
MHRSRTAIGSLPVAEPPAQLARIAVDLGIEEPDGGNTGSARWRPSFRRRRPDFCELFAADGVRQLETFLANWAAYEDYLGRRRPE